jgi:hypothetical protein
VNDPFNQAGFGAHRETETYYSEFLSKRNARSAMLTLSYTFGSKDNKQKRRERGNEGGDMDDVEW